MSSQIVGSPVQSKRDNLTIIIAGYAHSKLQRISWHVTSLGHALPLKTTPFQRTVTATGRSDYQGQRSAKIGYS